MNIKSLAGKLIEILQFGTSNRKEKPTLTVILHQHGACLCVGSAPSPLKSGTH